MRSVWPKFHIGDSDMFLSRFQILELPLSIGLIAGKVLRIAELVNAGEISMGYFLGNLPVIRRWNVRPSYQSVFLICRFIDIRFRQVWRYLLRVLWWDYHFGLSISGVIWSHCLTNIICELHAIDSAVIDLRRFFTGLWLHIGLEMAFFFDFLHILIETGLFSEHSYRIGWLNHIIWWFFIILLARIKLISIGCTFKMLFIWWISV